ncbi:FAD-dependent oxidoreductase [Botrimarina colliarenosi]|uniref:FAD-dependent oxidoreductase n=1 Tax=Botrimarina colliarenosi TaxID=2528001 RepID=UPI0011B61BC9|nr:FAD-dependent oxidoreductase [Botrimarina colliarenosi]
MAASSNTGGSRRLAINAEWYGRLRWVVRLNAPVESLTTEGDTHDGGVMVGGVRHQARLVVLATDGPAADHLLGETGGEWRSTACVYFATAEAPIDEPILLLAGDGPDAGPINSLCVPSLVSRAYAPNDHALVSVSVVGDPAVSDDELVESILHQAREWFGQPVATWQLLRVYRVRHALPDQRPPHYRTIEKSTRARQRVFVCGDRFDTASINGAIRSGHRTAEAVLRELDA